MANIVKANTQVTELANSKVVPNLVKETISQDDWDAMPPAERLAAIEFFQAEQAETTEGLKITFPRIKYPTSGTGVFEIPSAAGTPEYKPNIVGVIVSKRNVRAWWPLNQPISNNPPECFSDDAIRPNPASPQKQADICDRCPQSQFGSGKAAADGGTARSQACKHRINVFMLRDDPVEKKLEDIPTLLSIPPSQLKAFAHFAVQVRKHGSFLSQCTDFALTEAQSKDGTKYKGLLLKLGRKLSYAEMQSARQIADAFRDQMESRGLVPDEETDSPVKDAAGKDVIDVKGEEVPF